MGVGEPVVLAWCRRCSMFDVASAGSLAGRGWNLAVLLCPECVPVVAAAGWPGTLDGHRPAADNPTDPHTDYHCPACTDVLCNRNVVQPYPCPYLLDAIQHGDTAAGILTDVHSWVPVSDSLHTLIGAHPHCPDWLAVLIALRDA